MSQPDLLYEVRSSKELGRYLIASRDIQPREIIIREDPLISGPTDRGPKNIPVCLGCNLVMSDNPTRRCTLCHWPVCSENCEKLPCHAQNECLLFSKNRVLYPPPYGWPYISKSIVILRCLLLQTQDPQKWALLMNMADNKTIRAGKPNCINTDKRILQNFEKFMPFTKQEEYKDRVIQISGIIDTNAHAFPLSINGNSTTVCNLYSQTSLMAHSCLPNCSWSPDKSLSSLTLTIRSNLKISQGSILSVAYDDSQLLVCTLKRLVPNEINGMFICHCERCVDPTELGSYIGALKCPGCATGYLLPIDPLDSFSSWKCDNGNSKAGEEGESGNCNQVLDDESIMEMLEEAEQICGYTKLSLGLGSAANSEDEIGCLELLKEFDKEYELLHPNHYILQEVNVRILKGDYRQGLGALQDWDLRLYLERCERLLGIANVLTPGFCEYQAFLQFHFCQGLLCLERRKEGLEEEEDDDVEKDDDHENDADRHCVKKDDDENGDDGNLGANKLKHQKGNKMSDDGGATKLRNGNQVEIVGSRKNNAREEEENAGNLFWGKYSDSKENCKRLLEMLSFLVDFFQELNPDHRMLLPIKETIQDTETKLEKQ